MTTATTATPVDFEAYGDYGSAMTAPKGTSFERPRYPFRGRIGSDRFPAEAGRYHIYASYACPWAQRSLIVRRLKGLEEAVSVGIVDPVRDGRGWAFRDGDGHGPDTVGGFTLLREAYEATEPGYDGHISVPVLWDTQTRRIVSNNFPDITMDLNSCFNAWAAHGIDLYPQGLRSEIDELNRKVYATVNNGVYRCGFAPTQEAYNNAVLGSRSYLLGDTITEADVRLWVTLVRFDTVYATHFKTNIRRLVDYPNLWGYTRDLYALPAFRETTDFDHIKRHYYTTHGALNPKRIVPAGPVLDFSAPHDRARLSERDPHAQVVSPRPAG